MCGKSALMVFPQRAAGPPPVEMRSATSAPKMGATKWSRRRFEENSRPETEPPEELDSRLDTVSSETDVGEARFVTSGVGPRLPISGEWGGAGQGSPTSASGDGMFGRTTSISKFRKGSEWGKVTSGSRPTELDAKWGHR